MKHKIEAGVLVRTNTSLLIALSGAFIGADGKRQYSKYFPMSMTELENFYLGKHLLHYYGMLIEATPMLMDSVYLLLRQSGSVAQAGVQLWYNLSSLQSPPTGFKPPQPPKELRWQA